MAAAFGAVRKSQDSARTSRRFAERERFSQSSHEKEDSKQGSKSFDAMGVSGSPKLLEGRNSCSVPENMLSRRFAAEDVTAVLPTAVDPRSQPDIASVLFNPRNVLKEDVALTTSLEGKTILKEGTLLKRVEARASWAWSPRWLSLCTDCVLVCNEKGSQVKDVITLLEIGDIHVWNHAGGFASNHTGKGLNEDLASLQRASESKMSKREQAYESHQLAKGRIKTQGATTITEKGHLEVLEELEWENSVCISLPFQRRVFHFKAATAEDCDEWVGKLREARAEAFRQYRISLELSAQTKFRLAVMHAYEHRFTQWFIALILLLNFLVNILECQSARDENVEMKQRFDQVDLAFSVFYAVELAIHMYGRWFWDFWSDGWCIMDFVIVVLSVIDTIILQVVHNNGRKSRKSLCSSVLL